MPGDQVTVKDASGVDVPLLTDTVTRVNGITISPSRESERVRVVEGPDGDVTDVNFSTLLTAIATALADVSTGADIATLLTELQQKLEPADLDRLHTDLVAILGAFAEPLTWSKQSVSSGVNNMTVTAPSNGAQRLRLSQLKVTWTPTLPTTPQIVTVYDGPGTSSPVLDRFDSWQAVLDYKPALAASPGNPLTVNVAAVAGTSSRLAVVGYTA